MSSTTPLLSALCTLKDGGTLSSSEMSAAFRIIMQGDASDGVIGGFLAILATRVPTGEELFGAAVVMREHVDSVDFPDPSSLIDTCGTGGAPKTFNVSTAAGIVTAACGVRVAKHGNRSRTGRGSAEVLEQLGIRIDVGVDVQKKCLEEVGICFCFAPVHHKAVAHVMPVRKEFGFPTIFNLLGPLTNPCSAGRQLLGVWGDVYVEPVAKALRALGTTKSVVVHSEDGLDEISISAPTRMLFVDRDHIVEERLDPEMFGLKRWDIESVTTNTLDGAKRLIIESLTGGQESGAKDMVVMSSAVSLFLADRVENVREGVELASEVINSGGALETLDAWRAITHTLSTEQERTKK